MRLTLAIAVVIALGTFSTAADAARYKVTISGKQTDKISGSVPSVNGGCDYTTTTSAQSSFKFKTRRAGTVRYPSAFPGRVRLSVKSSGNLIANTVLNPGQNAATCPANSTINETCPAATKRSSFSVYLFSDTKLFRAIRGEQDLLLKAKCPTWGRFSGLGGFVQKKFSVRKIKRSKGMVIKATSSETQLIHSIGNLTTTLKLKARIQPK